MKISWFIVVREAEIANMPFLGALAGCSARRSERLVASHTSEEQRRNAPDSAAQKWDISFFASLRGLDREKADSRQLAGAPSSNQRLMRARSSSVICVALFIGMVLRTTDC